MSEDAEDKLTMHILDLESRIKADPYNPLHYIALAKAYLEQGIEDKARNIVAAKRRLPSNDPSIHFAWAKLCEELAMARQAMECYEKAIALNPKNSEYHYRVAYLYYEKGAWEKTIKHLEKAIQLSPHYDEAKEMLALLYQEMGFTGVVTKLKEEKEKVPHVPKLIHLEFKKEDLSQVLHLFQGKEFGYAKFYIGEIGRPSHSFVNGVLGLKEILLHIKGEETFGIYPLRSDRTLRFCAIWVKIPWGKILANIKNYGFLTMAEDNVHRYAKTIMGAAKEYGVPCYLENSGERDRRVWFFFEEFIPLKLAERFLNNILDKIHAPPPDITLALLLGFKGAGIGWEEDPVALPLGFNRKTSLRCLFINERGDSYEDQLLWMKKVRVLKRSEIQDFVRIISKGDYVLRQEEKFESLKAMDQKCPVLKEIILKANSGRVLSKEEKLVLFFTLGFLKDGLYVLHHVLEPCPDYRPHKVEKAFSRLGANPISCPKIRQLLPEITAYLSCNCAFEIPEGGYPTPLLHVDPKWVPGRLEKAPLSIDEIRKQYWALNKKIEELTQKRDKLKAILQQSEAVPDS